jgi:hypothetical protein
MGYTWPALFIFLDIIIVKNISGFGTQFSPVGFEVVTEVVMKSYIFWDVTLCNTLEVSRRFRGTDRLYFYGPRINQPRSQREAGSNMFLQNVRGFQPTTWPYTPEDRILHSFLLFPGTNTLFSTLSSTTLSSAYVSPIMHLPLLS